MKATFDVKKPTVYTVSGCNPVCSGNNFSYVWVIMAGVDPVSNYSQFGPAVDNSNSNQDLMQCKNGLTVTNLYRANPAPSGSRHTYRIDDQGTPNDEWAMFDGSHVLTCSDISDPYGSQETGNLEIGEIITTNRNQYEGKISDHEQIGGATATNGSGLAFDFFSSVWSGPGAYISGDLNNIEHTTPTSARPRR